MMRTIRQNVSETGNRRSKGFTLIELLAVVVIMSIIMGLLAINLNQSRGPVTRSAAAQVAAGLQLARQMAISKNAEARFVIAPVGKQAGMPEEPFRYWAVVYSNKEGDGWLLAKDWEPLPGGAIFLNLATKSYSTINWDTISKSDLGTPHKPVMGADKAGKEWEGFSSYGNMTVTGTESGNAVNINLNNTPYVAFRPDGRARFSDGAGMSKSGAIRVAEGTAVGADQVMLKTTNNAFYIETDMQFGKVKVRARESYRLN